MTNLGRYICMNKELLPIATTQHAQASSANSSISMDRISSSTDTNNFELNEINSNTIYDDGYSTNAKNVAKAPLLASYNGLSNSPGVATTNLNDKATIRNESFSSFDTNSEASELETYLNSIESSNLEPELQVYLDENFKAGNPLLSDSEHLGLNSNNKNKKPNFVISMLTNIWRTAPVTSLERLTQEYSEAYSTKDLNSINETETSPALINSNVLQNQHTINLFKKRILLSGVGSELRIYDLLSNNKCIASFEVLPKQRIHGIRQDPIYLNSLDQPNTLNKAFIVFGGRMYRIIVIRFIINIQSNSISSEIILKDFGCDYLNSLPLRIVNTDDWIKDISWLKHNKDESFSSIIGIIYARNFVEFRNLKNHSIIYKAFSAEKCILYSARFFGNTIDDLLIASGTVFNAVVIWKPYYSELLSKEMFNKQLELSSTTNYSETSITDFSQNASKAIQNPVCLEINSLHVLYGHKGVIFGIRFSKDGLSLTSTSDDRTIRLWEFDSISHLYKINPKKSENNTILNLDCKSTKALKPDIGQNIKVYEKNFEGPKTTILYGHSSRIWDCIILKEYMVSISEDATCRIWSRDSDNNFKTIGVYRDWHNGKNLWSLAADEQQGIILTGGEDGGIKSWSLKDINSRQIGNYDLMNKISLKNISLNGFSDLITSEWEKLRVSDSIRNFTRVSLNEILILTSQGYLLLYNEELLAVKKATKIDKIKRYGIMASVNNGKNALIATISGTILLTNNLVSNEDITYIEYAPLKHQSNQISHIYVIEADILNFQNKDENVKYYWSITVDINKTTLIHLIYIKNQISSIFTLYELEMPKSSDLSSVDISLELGWIVVGTVLGAILVYQIPLADFFEAFNIYNSNLKNESFFNCIKLCPIINWRRVHGNFSISAVKIRNDNLLFNHPKSEFHSMYHSDILNYKPSYKSCAILSGGRDGNISEFSLKVFSDKAKPSKNLIETCKTLILGKDDKMGNLDICSTSNGIHDIIYIQVQNDFSKKITKGWVENITEQDYRPKDVDLLQKDSLSSGIIAHCFYKGWFSALDITQEFESLSIVCGGAHRKWDYSIYNKHIEGYNKLSSSMDPQVQVFSFIRKAELFTYHIDNKDLLKQQNEIGLKCSTEKKTTPDNISDFNIENDNFLANQIIQNKFHGREIRAISWTKISVNTDNGYQHQTQKSDLLVDDENANFLLASAGEEGAIILSLHCGKLNQKTKTEKLNPETSVNSLSNNSIVWNSKIILERRGHTSAIRSLKWISDCLDLQNEYTTPIQHNNCKNQLNTNHTNQLNYNNFETKYLLSAGGSEELCLWKVDIIGERDSKTTDSPKNLESIQNSSELSKDNIKCSLWALCPPISSNKSHRITSIASFYYPIPTCYIDKIHLKIFNYLHISYDEYSQASVFLPFVAAGYSDGSVRLYSIFFGHENSKKNIFKNDADYLNYTGLKKTFKKINLEDINLQDKSDQIHSLGNNVDSMNLNDSGNNLNVNKSAFDYVGISPTSASKRCVLTLSSLVIDNTSIDKSNGKKKYNQDKNLDEKNFKSPSSTGDSKTVLLFSGNTGGLVLVWDITKILNEYMLHLIKNGSLYLEEIMNRKSFSLTKNAQNYDNNYWKPSCWDKVIYYGEFLHQSGVNDIDCKLVNSKSLSIDKDKFNNVPIHYKHHTILISTAGEDDSCNYIVLGILNKLEGSHGANRAFSQCDLISSDSLNTISENKKYSPRWQVYKVDLLAKTKIENAHSASVQSISILSINRMSCDDNSSDLTTNSIQKLSSFDDKAAEYYLASITSVSTDQRLITHDLNITLTYQNNEINAANLSDTHLTIDCSISVTKGGDYKEYTSMVADPTCISTIVANKNKKNSNLLIAIAGVGLEVLVLND
ncbi:hypothetical protein BB561_001538 [Smittium simulii]|uniref:Uncharacterized protein n=1 Tax=Smittium simulii TaxID=133385 RepID=A0A2T9YU63_9FUNG|nr:hypothetical protein BB561_001538 [Smittium simulii]